MYLPIGARTTSQPAGFTLIELLVVVAIVAMRKAPGKDRPVPSAPAIATVAGLRKSSSTPWPGG
jgi:prepilin-type N-terminal cleavage/methylation domain-containing protein